jgi:hypothetical protein
LLEHESTLLKRCAGGEDVIDKNERPPRGAPVLTRLERVSHVSPTRVTSEFRLRLRVSSAHEAVSPYRHLQSPRELLTEQLGLVEATPGTPPRMKWYGHEGLATIERQSGPFRSADLT